MKVYIEVARNGKAAVWLGSLSGLAIIFALWDEPILTRFGIGGGVFLIAFFTTGYFHLVVLSKKVYFHFYNWMLLPLFSIARWKSIKSATMVSYDRRGLEDMSDTMMVVHGNWSPIERTPLWPAAKNEILNEKLINYIHLESETDMHDFPLEVFRQPKQFLDDVLKKLKATKEVAE